MPPGAVYVGRPTLFGNPFRPGVNGTPEECVALYRRYLDGEIGPEDTAWRNGLLHDPKFEGDPYRGKTIVWAGLLEKLRGHDLACWCPLDQPCHVDVLLELANAEKGETS